MLFFHEECGYLKLEIGNSFIAKKHSAFNGFIQVVLKEVVMVTHKGRMTYCFRRSLIRVEPPRYSVAQTAF